MEDLSLKNNEVHVWRASLDIADSQIEILSGALSHNERTRSEKYHFERDQKRFIAGRGILRNILSRYLKTEPEEIVFSSNAHGKPFLSDACNNKEISFNLSHAHDLALYAVTAKRRVGIDLEYIQQAFQWEAIVERFFSPGEQAEIWTLPEKERCRAFYTYWTRKEAFLKAQGLGLTNDIKEVDVNFKSEGSAPLLKLNRAPDKADCWELHDLYPGFGYAGALAVDGRGLGVNGWHWR